MPTLPSALQPAIKRAKLAIQDALLSPSDPNKLALAERAVQNAHEVASKKGRKNWDKEILMVPHYQLHSWYCETKDVQWSLTSMPQWAKNGRTEPIAGIDMINGFLYTDAPKSTGR